MSHNDSNFYKPFAFVLGALVLFTLFIAFVANMVSPDSGEDPLVAAELKKTIAPVGRSRAAEPEQTVATKEVKTEDSQVVATEAQTETAAPAADATESKAEAAAESTAIATTEEMTEADKEATTTSGTGTAETSTSLAVDDVSMKVKATVATNCAGCHNVGLNGAAKPDDAAAWNTLAEKGLDELTASVINGKGKMPARAESSLSDAEIGQAVQLMIANATGKAASKTSTASTDTVATETNAVTDTGATGASAQETVATVTEIPAEVKTVVDSTCAACHINGIANAPKFGDRAAWDARMEKGLDALTASAIAGIGGMPPRGASSLNDEQMRLAVEYMIGK